MPFVADQPTARLVTRPTTPPLRGGVVRSRLRCRRGAPTRDDDISLFPKSLPDRILRPGRPSDHPRYTPIRPGSLRKSGVVGSWGRGGSPRTAASTPTLVDVVGRDPRACEREGSVEVGVLGEKATGRRKSLRAAGLCPPGPPRGKPPSAGKLVGVSGGTQNAGEEETRTTGNPYPVNSCRPSGVATPWETLRAAQLCTASTATPGDVVGRDPRACEREGSVEVAWLGEKAPQSEPSPTERGPRPSRGHEANRPGRANSRPRERNGSRASGATGGRAPRETTGGIPRCPQIQATRQ
jgi:hypothetical protein